MGRLLVLATLLVSLSACQNDSNPAPTPTPTATVFTLTGHITDGTSHGVLPGINVQITSGPNTGANAKSDASGNYSVGNLAAAECRERTVFGHQLRYGDAHDKRRRRHATSGRGAAAHATIKEVVTGRSKLVGRAGT